ncbi:dihydrofolate reductase family protein [Phaeobacter sp. NW0010-22]|uniref:dihydrofolate reductase family protein n=1 Tax=Phaeobacter sp. NW0010-22 TaxID=3135907 RepID=UPI003109F32F
MPTGHIMMATSLDGFVARPDHTLDWLDKQPSEGEDHGFDAFQDSVDVIVMGSGSFRTVLGFGEWPYAKPVVVLSRSMTQNDVPDSIRGKVEIMAHEPAELMANFTERGFERVYVDGGAVIQSFMKAKLIADMKITIVPILIGAGIRIFDNADCDTDLEMVSSEQFPSGLVDLVYKVKAA